MLLGYSSPARSPYLHRFVAFQTYVCVDSTAYKSHVIARLYLCQKSPCVPAPNRVDIFIHLLSFVNQPNRHIAFVLENSWNLQIGLAPRGSCGAPCRTTCYFRVRYCLSLYVLDENRKIMTSYLENKSSTIGLERFYFNLLDPKYF